MICPPGCRNTLNRMTRGWKKAQGVPRLGIPSAIHGNMRVDVLSKRVPCELHASRVHHQTTIPVRENFWRERCSWRETGENVKRWWTGSKPSPENPRVGSARVSDPDLLLSSPSRLPPLSTGTATPTDHTGCRSGAARPPFHRSAHRLQTDTSLFSFEEHAHPGHQETEGQF